MEEDEDFENEGLDEEPEFQISEQKLRKLKNLKMFRGMSDAEIKQYLKNKEAKAPPPAKPLTEDMPEDVQYDEKEYQKKYRTYYKRYQDEYGVDMNDANDRQNLEQLVRLVIQSEYADEFIRRLQSTKSFSTKNMKDMGDYQRSVQTSITDLQDRLGISRKARKEKQIDTIPQYIRDLQIKAKDLWNRSTKPVRCEKCQVELARFWLNFPDNVENVSFTIECENCHERVVFVE